MSPADTAQPITTPVPVLGDGFVRLVDFMGSDLSIVRAARVSYDADWRAGDDGSADEKLIRYLMRNKHTSPFEAVTFTFEIKCPMFIARQWHRHRTWSYNEVSARYAMVDTEYYVPDWEIIGRQATGNKQMRDIEEALLPEERSMAQRMARMMAESNQRAFAFYETLVAAGCPRELARSVLPMATYTRFFGTVDLHNLMHFLRLRLHKHAQYEIRVYAEALRDLTRLIVPVAMGAFDDFEEV